MAHGQMTCMMGRLLTDLEEDIESDRQGKGQVPHPTPRLPYDAYTPPLGHFIAPKDAPFVKHPSKHISLASLFCD